MALRSVKNWWIRELHASGFHVFHIFGFIIVALIGTGCSLLPYFLLKSSDHQTVLSELSTDLTSFSYSFSIVIRDSMTEVFFLQTIVATHTDSASNVTAIIASTHLLSEYLAYIHQDFTYSQLGGIAFALRVPYAQKAAFEQMYFPILQQYPNGTFGPAGVQADYYPLNEGAQVGSRGFDISSDPSIAAGMAESVSQASLVYVSTSNLISPNTKGVVLLSPIYTTALPPTNTTAREASVAGFVAGIIDVVAIVTNSVDTQRRLHDVNIYIFDSNAAPPQNLLYPLNSPYSNAMQIPPFDGIKMTQQLDIANWTVVFVPTQAYVNRYTTAFPLVVLIAILVFTVCILFFMCDQIRKRGIIKRVLEEKRTILNSILPEEITERLLAGQVIADKRDNAVVFFMDIAGFTDFSSRESATDVVRLLDNLFTAIDKLAVRYGVEKIKTIGDCYMAANGIFSGPQNLQHNISRMLDFALDVSVVARATFAQTPSTQELKVRIGVHAGVVMAGVICVTCKPHFDIWGDAVNVASRMESTGEPERIQVSEIIAQTVENLFDFQQRGQPVMVKGKGLMITWFLLGRRVVAVPPPPPLEPPPSQAPQI